MGQDEIDVFRARQDTLGCKNVLHFNNADAALIPKQVLDATTGYLNLEAEIGGYEAAKLSHEAVEHVYDAASSLIGCQRDEIALIENATRAWDMAFYAIPFKSGDRTLTSVAEYGSNYIAFLQIARRTGAVIDVIPNERLTDRTHRKFMINSRNRRSMFLFHEPHQLVLIWRLVDWQVSSVLQFITTIPKMKSNCSVKRLRALLQQIYKKESQVSRQESEVKKAFVTKDQTNA